jgi:Zn-dependent M28 family amino/carboxypeptidase
MGPADAIRARAIPLKFQKKGESISFRIDAQDVLWAREISSIWPSEKLFAAVEPGLYDIQLVLESESGDSESEKLPITVGGPARGKPKS